jgi:hypothetical protein
MKCYQILWRAYLRGDALVDVDLRKVQETSFPAGVWGVSEKPFSLFVSAASSGDEKKRMSRGHPLQPRQEALPLESRLG